MRGTVFVLAFAAMCGSAQASSFVVMDDRPASTPSIVTLGQPEATAAALPAAPADPSLDPMQRALGEMQPADWQAAPSRQARARAEPVFDTPSIIALGEPEAEISYDKVAAIPKVSGPRFSPMVIRGGIVGGRSAGQLLASGRSEYGTAAAQPEAGGGPSTSDEAPSMSNAAPQKAPL